MLNNIQQSHLIRGAIAHYSSFVKIAPPHWFSARRYPAEYSPLYVHYPEYYSGIPCLYTIHFTPLTKNHPNSHFYLLNSK